MKTIQGNLNGSGQQSPLCDKIFTNGPSKVCGRQPLKYLKGYGLLKQKIAKILFGSFLNILSHIW